MNVIFLTSDQANAVRGETAPGHYIDPVPYLDGYILPLSVLDDAAHALLHEQLAGFLVIEFLPAPDPELT